MSDPHKSLTNVVGVDFKTIRDDLLGNKSFEHHQTCVIDDLSLYQPTKFINGYSHPTAPGTTMKHARSGRRIHVLGLRMGHDFMSGRLKVAHSSGFMDHVSTPADNPTNALPIAYVMAQLGLARQFYGKLLQGEQLQARNFYISFQFLHCRGHYETLQGTCFICLCILLL